MFENKASEDEGEEEAVALVQPAVQPLEIVMDSWVACARCSKWRRLPATDADALQQLALDSDWYCSDNPDSERADCR